MGKRKKLELKEERSVWMFEKEEKHKVIRNEIKGRKKD